MIPTAMLLSAAAVFASTGGASGLYIDLLDIQWWQAILAIATALGLSGAPWLTALAAGRLLFRADLERQLAGKDKEHARAQAEKDANHARAMAEQKEHYEALRRLDAERYGELKESNAANVLAAQAERQRADEVTDAALEVVDVVRANSHIMESFHQAAKIADGEQAKP